MLDMNHQGIRGREIAITQIFNLSLTNSKTMAFKHTKSVCIQCHV
jgi:hypothetical protein